MARPEERYLKLKIKTRSDGVRVYAPAIPKTVAVSDDDTTFVANERDRADIIANNAYGSPLHWWRIAAANRKVNGSIHFKPGQTVTIPKA